MRGLLFKVVETPVCYFASDMEREGGDVEFRTFHVCVKERFHVSYTLKTWCAYAGFGKEHVLYSELVSEDDEHMFLRPSVRSGWIRPCDGACRQEFNLELFVREDTYCAFYGNADEVLAELRSASPETLLARVFSLRFQEDGDGEAWHACTDSTHFTYEITEYGMGGYFEHGPCDGSCAAREIIIPPAVTRELRARRVL